MNNQPNASQVNLKRTLKPDTKEGMKSILENSKDVVQEKPQQNDASQAKQHVQGTGDSSSRNPGIGGHVLILTDSNAVDLKNEVEPSVDDKDLFPVNHTATGQEADRLLDITNSQDDISSNNQVVPLPGWQPAFLNHQVVPVLQEEVAVQKFVKFRCDISFWSDMKHLIPQSSQSAALVSIINKNIIMHRHTNKNGVQFIVGIANLRLLLTELDRLLKNSDPHFKRQLNNLVKEVIAPQNALLQDQGEVEVDENHNEDVQILSLEAPKEEENNINQFSISTSQEEKNIDEQNNVDEEKANLNDKNSDDHEDDQEKSDDHEDSDERGLSKDSQEKSPTEQSGLKKTLASKKPLRKTCMFVIVVLILLIAFFLIYSSPTCLCG